MKKLIFLIIAFFQFSNSVIFCQCGAIEDQFYNSSGPSFPADDPQYAGVVFYKSLINTNTFEYVGYGYQGQTFEYNLNIDSVTSMVFFNLCHNATILNNSPSEYVGSICISTFECQNDLFFYTPPQTYNPADSVVFILFEYMFSQTPLPVLLKLNIKQNCQLPILLNPENESKTDTTVTLEWSAVPDNIIYELQIAYDEGFSDIFYVTNTISTSKFFDGLESNKKYHWRTKSITNNCIDGIFSEPWSFITCIPTLISPEDEVEKQDKSVLVTWSEINDASTYILQYDTLMDFSTAIEKQISEPLDTLKNLLYSTKYHWRVKAITDLCPEGEWSEPRHFYTQSRIDLFAFHIETEEVSLVDSLFNKNQSVFEFTVVADGTNSMVFTSNKGTLEIRDVINEDLSGKISTLSNQMLTTFSYDSPKEYTSDNKIIYLDYDLDFTPTNPDMTIKLNLRPTPVLLLHGLASNAEMWQPLWSYLNSTNDWDLTYMLVPSYQNDASFLVTGQYIQDYLHSNIGLITSLRNNKVFVNQTSIVGHSMGGLLARSYLQTNPSNKSVSRLITLNTPHFGSEFANFVRDGKLGGIGTVIGEWVLSGDSNNASGTFSIYSGALNSLRVNSLEIQNINSGLVVPVPVHSITTVNDVCDYFGVLEDLEELEPHESWKKSIIRAVALANKFVKFANWIGTIGNAICAINEYFLGEENDAVVRLESQKGNLEGSSTTNFEGIFGTLHINSYENTDIIHELIPDLLKANPNGNSFGQNWFPPGMLEPPFAPNGNNENNFVLDTIVEIEITNLTNYDTISSSNNNFIQIVGNSFTQSLMIMYYFQNDSIIIDSTFTGSFSFPIPTIPNYEGNIRIGVMGTDGYGHVDFDTLNVVMRSSTVNVTAAGLQGNISVYPNPFDDHIIIEGLKHNIESIKIFDSIGNLLIVSYPFTFTSNLNVSQLHPGIYFVQIEHHGNVITKKLIKTK